MHAELAPGQVVEMDGRPMVSQGSPSNSIEARLERIERLLLVIVERVLPEEEEQLAASLDDPMLPGTYDSSNLGELFARFEQKGSLDG